ncbi:signal transduction histidine kinase [Catenulispora sp. EB89]
MAGMLRPSSAGVRGASGPLLVAVGVVVVTALDGPSSADQMRALIPLAAVVVGMVLVLRDLAAERRGTWLGVRDRGRRAVDARTAIGALVIGGALVRLLTNGASFAAETSAVVAALILFSGGVLIALPYLLRVLRDLDAERAERIRAQQFGEVAAHMHDSVLHTLTLIQRADPADVAGLARAQERELRAWLYDRRGRAEDGTEPETFAAAVRAAAAEVEDRHGVRVEVVAVGDAELGDGLGACVAAAREALVNAAKYAGGAPISVFAEVEDEGSAGQRRVAVYVRDRGPGFELDAVGADRMGIRESIVGRMARHGGVAEVRTAPGAGTEVRLEMRCE